MYNLTLTITQIEQAIGAGIILLCSPRRSRALPRGRIR